MGGWSLLRTRVLHLRGVAPDRSLSAGRLPAGRQYGSQWPQPALRAALLLALLALVLLPACDAGDITLVAPERRTAATPTLVVRAVVNEAHQELAEALGWTAGIPGARVRVHKTDEPYDEDYWVEGETDAGGVVEFFDLLRGMYEVQVTRPLSKEEAAHAGRDVQVVAGGRWLLVPWQPIQDVAATPNQASGLVFGEVAITYPLPWETGGPTYTYGTYFELFNNSDRTVFLDGMILGFAWRYYFDSGIGWTCAVSEPFRTDPDGIWTKQFLRFPGVGTDYPVPPGSVVLVARSAVDHTPIHWSLSDLSHADFEFGSQGGEAGNPDVPDLASIGLEPLFINTPLTGDPLFLAGPIDVETLPRMSDAWSGRPWVRFPRAAIADVVIGVYDYARGVTAPPPRCSQAIDPHFETLPGPATWDTSSDGPAWTVQRRVLFTSDGRKILQDTNTSMADFVRAWKTPGWVPDSIGGGGP